MADRPARGLLDTSVVIDLETLDQAALVRLPLQLAVSILTMAELSAGPHAAANATERAVRQDRLQRAEATFEAIPFDGEASRAYGRVYAAVTSAGRKARGPRMVDLLIAATAVAHEMPVVTRNVADFRSLEDLVEIIEV